MQIPVARMEDVDSANARSVRFVVDQLQQLCQCSLGNHSILHHKIGTQLPHQSPGNFASFPQLLA